jgi:hypothetical protein
MDAMNWVAIVGAAAWAPQIITWVCRTLTKPKVSLYADSKSQIGYNTLGPIFNVSFALLSEKKDAILNKFSVKLRHENGASYTFDWDGLSEDLSEIQNPLGPIMSIKKTSLPLVVKVLHTGVAQVFVRFQHRQFKANSKNLFASALDEYNLLKTSGKLSTAEDIEALVSNKEFNDVIKLFNSEFIWSAGKYTVTFEFKSPNKFKYKKSEYIFKLGQDDIDNLRKNIANAKLDIIEAAKRDIISGYKRKDIMWEWRLPELEKK